MLKTGIYVDAENIRLCGGYGMRYFILDDNGLSPQSVFFQCSRSDLPNDSAFQDTANVFEFTIVESDSNEGRTEAWEISLFEE